MSLAAGRAAIGLSGIQLIHHTHAEQHVNVQHTHGDHTHTSTGGTDSGGSGTGSGSGTVYFINGVVSADLSADPILADTDLADYLRVSDVSDGLTVLPTGDNAILTTSHGFKTVANLAGDGLTELPTGNDAILTTSHGFKTVSDVVNPLTVLPTGQEEILTQGVVDTYKTLDDIPDDALIADTDNAAAVAAILTTSQLGAYLDVTILSFTGF